MNSLGKYIRLQDPRNNHEKYENKIGESEIIRLTIADGSGDNLRFIGECFSGETLSIDIHDFEEVVIPELRSDELCFVCSIAEYNSEYSNDISFDLFTIIVVKKSIDEHWLEGSVIGANGKRLGCSGLFPKCFAIELDVSAHSFEPKTPPLCSPSQISFTEARDSVRFRKKTFERAQTESMENLAEKFRGDSCLLPENSLGIANVVYDFDGRDSFELTVYNGDCLSVLEFLPNDWARCYDPGRNRFGIVPVSFLNIFLNENDECDRIERLGDDMNQISEKLDAFKISSGHETGRAHLLRTEESKPVDWSEFIVNFPDLLELSTDRKTPVRPPPPKFGSRSDSTHSALEREQSADPLALSLVNSSLKHLATGFNVLPNDDTNASNKLVTKKRTIDDLISSEQNYLNDLLIWETTIRESTEISCDQKRILMAGTTELKDLSRKLLSALSEENSKSLVAQHFGHVFMYLHKDFIRTYAANFGNFVEKVKMVEGNDVKLKMALENCLIEMKALGSTVFDLHSAISRPIQRAMKYPVFIEAILKGTEITNVDHPRLLEAQKRMNALAAKMNESKRRKELNVKYLSNEAQPLSKRLSKLNVHSMKKKSNRFKYRISSQFGLINIDQDSDFNTLTESLRSAQRRICRFLHALQVYKRLMITRSKRYIDLYASKEKLSHNSCQTNLEIKKHCMDLSLLINSLVEFVNNKVGNNAKKYLRIPITRLIQKRYDKLIDYVSGKKEGRSTVDVKLAKCDYEALNVQLKAKLPKIIEGLNLRILYFLKSLIVFDISFTSELEAMRFGLSENARATLAIPFRNFTDPNYDRLKVFVSIGAQIGHEFKSSARSLVPWSCIFELEFKTGQVKECRSQTIAERRMMIQIITVQGLQNSLMIVKKRWPAVDLGQSDRINQFCVEVGDVVIVLAHGNNSCLCDNGVVKGCLPLDCLGPFDREKCALESSSDDLPPNFSSIPRQILLNHHDAALNFKGTEKYDEINLIDFDEKSLKLRSLSIEDSAFVINSPAKRKLSCDATTNNQFGSTETFVEPMDPFDEFCQLCINHDSQSSSRVAPPPIPLRPDRPDFAQHSSLFSDAPNKPIRKAPPIPATALLERNGAKLVGT